MKRLPLRRTGVYRRYSTMAPERLETRRLMSGMLPTNAEQYMLELVNRARANPAAEAAADGIDLNEGLAPGTISSAAKQPLAFSPYLIDSATGHSQWMIANDNFTHYEGRTGYNTPGDRMTTAGYSFTGSWGWGENIAWQGSYPSAPALNPTVASEEKDLFVDSSEPGRGHRINITDPSYKEIGIGVVTGAFAAGGTSYQSVMTTQDFAYSGSASFLTGVAYNDANKNKFYDPGEGLAGITITATSGGKSYSTTTWSTGGYTLALNPGTYSVTASGTGLGAAQTTTVTIGAMNVEADFLAGAIVAPSGSIAGTVYNDANADGVHQSTETGVFSGVTINLHNTADASSTTINATTKTTSAGTYSFGSLSAGTYLVTEVIPAGRRATTATSLKITIGAGLKLTGENFLQTTKSLISGVVFYDKNKNGKLDTGEALAGVTIYLETSTGGVITSTRTGTNGSWSFNDLAAGTYVVKAAAVAGHTLSSPTAGSFKITIGSGSVLAGYSFIEK